jgi:hypothetical protein
MSNVEDADLDRVRVTSKCFYSTNDSISLNAFDRPWRTSRFGPMHWCKHFDRWLSTVMKMKPSLTLFQRVCHADLHTSIDIGERTFDHRLDPPQATNINLKPGIAGREARKHHRRQLFLFVLDPCGSMSRGEPMSHQQCSSDQSSMRHFFFLV